MDNNEFDDDEILEYEEWQYDLSTDMAMEQTDEWLEVLEDFDYNNTTDGYIPGVATYVLYTKIVRMLVEQGYETEQLTDVIEECQELSSHRTIH